MISEQSDVDATEATAELDAAKSGLVRISEIADRVHQAHLAATHATAELTVAVNDEIAAMLATEPNAVRRAPLLALRDALHAGDRGRISDAERQLRHLAQS